MLKFFISSLFILIGCAGFSQSADSAKSYLPTGIRLGTDLITLGKGQFSNKFNGWELNGDVDFNRYHVAVDYGSWGRSLALKNGLYENDGRYWRVGVDVNFLLKDPDRNMFFLGFRYAGTKFNEVLVYEYTDATFGLVNLPLKNTDRTARWGELVTGLRVKIWRELWMGYTGRLKFSVKERGAKSFDTYDIPGYGTLAKDIYWGFNYQIFWRFAWKKNPGPLRNKD